jgi:putative toxin-antitoxin system antitoxin component (TIGR02293 family)
MKRTPLQLGDPPESLSPVFEIVNQMLGGPAILRHILHDEVDAHLLISQGVPTRALVRVVDDLLLLGTDALLLMLGISTRSYPRRKHAAARKPESTLSVEEGNRLLRFAALFAQAALTLGTKEAAQHWFNESQLALSGRRPIELLTTTPGARVVEDLLARLEYCVYT